MSSFNAPSTPSRTRRAPTSPTGLYVTFVSVIQDVVIPGFSEQFIDYGSVVLILLVGASIPNEGFNWEKANTFFRNTELCLHAHLFSRQALSWPMKEQSPFIVSGDLSPWGVRTAVGEKPEDTLMYQTIIMPTEETLHR
ncbi:hypothetical protein F4805DRAFT_409567 [Annulohypoxylon moriforme]|nr:hypothetical protein F4805DRAFT_409567 [Annulohypoxylon moriforme]